MAMYHRVGFTAAQSAELWKRWKKGEGLKSIGRAFGKPSSCIFAHLRKLEECLADNAKWQIDVFSGSDQL
jgi:hypothetical protein